MEEVVIVGVGHEINGGDDDGNPTPSGRLLERLSRKSREDQSQNLDLTASGNTVQVADPRPENVLLDAACAMWAVHRSKKPKYPIFW